VKFKRLIGQVDIWILIGTLHALSFGKFTKEAHEMLKHGSQAPNFVSKDQNGNDISISDFLGKWVAFFWYPKASTPG